ncbi:ArsR/SmtB family transcription factor [Ostreibacterium oceani]|nr:metalloregulator ArsR/SmtB family transcription factor [Ostreibacterium oceani]
MNKMSQQFKALSDLSRLRIIAALCTYDELCACHLSELLGFANATITRHMALLIAADWVRRNKQGRWVYYRLNTDNPLVQALQPTLIQTFQSDATCQADTTRLAAIIVASAADQKLCKLSTH